MKKYSTVHADLYIGEARELLSFLRNIVKRGMAVNPYPKRYINMNKNYGLIVEYYSEYESRYYDIPKAYIISANSALGNLVLDGSKEIF